MFPNLKFETKKKEKEKQQEETTHTHTHTLSQRLYSPLADIQRVAVFYCITMETLKHFNLLGMSELNYDSFQPLPAHQDTHSVWIPHHMRTRKYITHREIHTHTHSKM